MSETELTPEEQIEKMQAALDRYKKENEKFRTERDEWKSKYEEGFSNDETLTKYRTSVARAEAKLKLQSEGVKDADRIVGRMDLSGVTINDDGGVDGIDEQIKSLKSDLPELFDRKRRVGGGADATSRGETPSLTPTQQAVNRLFNK